MRYATPTNPPDRWIQAQGNEHPNVPSDKHELADQAGLKIAEGEVKVVEGEPQRG